MLGLFGPPITADLRRLDDEARARSPWFRDGMFQNFDGDVGQLTRGGLRRFLRWKLGPATAPLVPGAPGAPIDVRPLAAEALAPPARGVRVAWLGHSTFVVATPRLRIAIDPL